MIALLFAKCVIRREDCSCGNMKLNLVSDNDRHEYFLNIGLEKNKEYYNKEPVVDGAVVLTKTPDVGNPIGNQDEIDEYIKMFFLQDKFLKEPNIKITAEKTGMFRDNYFKFRDNIFKQSQQFTTGEKMNKLRLDDSKFDGKRISDVYDDLADVSDTYPELPIIKMPIQDTSAIQNVFYVKDGANGKYTADDTWIYDKDRLMNGGMFFNEIYPYDKINGNAYIDKL